MEKSSTGKGRRKPKKSEKKKKVKDVAVAVADVFVDDQGGEWTFPEAQCCGRCGKYGDIMWCSCPASFHPLCYYKSMDEDTDDEFVCNRCQHLPPGVCLFPPENNTKSQEPEFRVQNEIERNLEAMKFHYKRLRQEEADKRFLTNRGFAPLTKRDSKAARDRLVRKIRGMVNPMDYVLPEKFLNELDETPESKEEISNNTLWQCNEHIIVDHFENPEKKEKIREKHNVFKTPREEFEEFKNICISTEKERTEKVLHDSSTSNVPGTSSSRTSAPLSSNTPESSTAKTSKLSALKPSGPSFSNAPGPSTSDIPESSFSNCPGTSFFLSLKHPIPSTRERSFSKIPKPSTSNLPEQPSTLEPSTSITRGPSFSNHVKPSSSNTPGTSFSSIFKHPPAVIPKPAISKTPKLPKPVFNNVPGPSSSKTIRPSFSSFSGPTSTNLPRPSSSNTPGPSTSHLHVPSFSNSAKKSASKIPGTPSFPIFKPPSMIFPGSSTLNFAGPSTSKLAGPSSSRTPGPSSSNSSILPSPKFHDQPSSVHSIPSTSTISPPSVSAASRFSISTLLGLSCPNITGQSSSTIPAPSSSVTSGFSNLPGPSTSSRREEGKPEEDRETQARYKYSKELAETVLSQSSEQPFRHWNRDNLDPVGTIRENGVQCATNVWEVVRKKQPLGDLLKELQMKGNDGEMKFSSPGVGDFYRRSIPPPPSVDVLNPNTPCGIALSSQKMKFEGRGVYNRQTIPKNLEDLAAFGYSPQLESYEEMTRDSRGKEEISLQEVILKSLRENETEKTQGQKRERTTTLLGERREIEHDGHHPSAVELRSPPRKIRKKDEMAQRNVDNFQGGVGGCSVLKDGGPVDFDGEEKEKEKKEEKNKKGEEMTTEELFQYLFQHTEVELKTPKYGQPRPVFNHQEGTSTSFQGNGNSLHLQNLILQNTGNKEGERNQGRQQRNGMVAQQHFNNMAPSKNSTNLNVLNGNPFGPIGFSIPIIPSPIPLMPTFDHQEGTSNYMPQQAAHNDMNRIRTIAENKSKVRNRSFAKRIADYKMRNVKQTNFNPPAPSASTTTIRQDDNPTTQLTTIDHQEGTSNSFIEEEIVDVDGPLEEVQQEIAAAKKEKRKKKMDRMTEVIERNGLPI